MDFIDQLRALSGSARQRVPHALTEEATKNALVMPFLQVLGYDVFNPLEVVPEYVADVGTKRGEKVDYAILKDGEPIIIVECKVVGTALDTAKVTHLYRDFTTTAARFGILTDGLIYRFFSDLEEPNRMDTKPFLEFDLSEITPEDAANLKRFTRDSFNLADSIQAAENLKYTGAIKWVLADTMKRPHDAFVRFVLDQVHEGPKTKARVEKFRHLTRQAFREFINERIDQRLQSALASERDEPEPEPDPEPEPQPEPEPEPKAQVRKVETTAEELEAWEVVKTILTGTVDLERVQLQDLPGYCNINLDGGRRKNIVRLHFNRRNKLVGVLDEANREVRHPMDTPQDIHALAEDIRARVARLL